VLVSESVENVLGLAPPLDQTHHEQRLQPSGYGRDLLTLVFSQLRHASLARSEPHEKPESFRIAERSEHLGSGFDLYPRREPEREGAADAHHAGLPIRGSYLIDPWNDRI
jgi:hypothetical protein